MQFFSSAGKRDETTQHEITEPEPGIGNLYNGLDYLVELVKQVRPSRAKNYKEAEVKFRAGNVALGFLLGMAGFFGKIFGLPFDIRHITISSGSAPIAYYTTGNTPGLPFLLAVFVGILQIGLFNFLVSFALAF